ncbi:MAG TPA: NUDIX hydrolase [Dehalococcoidia bacterium]|nr:NUDIX hydrolase [Dehalococcoidia bacterium]
MASGKRSLRRTESAVSAGGVVYRADNGTIEVVICGRLGDGVWGLPKGTPDQGETLEETAVREVSEETGLRVEIVDKIGAVEYWFARAGVRYHKWVHHYLFQATGGDTESHDLEYDRVEWRPINDALRALTFKNEAEMVKQARSLIEKRLK